MKHPIPHDRGIGLWKGGVVAILATVMLLHAPVAFASPPLVVDYVTGISATPVERSFGGNDTHSNFAIVFTPLADTGLCELQVYMAKYNGNLTGASARIDVIASPSTPFFYSWTGDGTLDASGWTTSYTGRLFTFYNAAGVGTKPAGVTATLYGGSVTPGTCPVLYGGHQYWIYVSLVGGSADPRLTYQYWGLDISKYTHHGWYRNDTTLTVQELTSEVEFKAWGFGTFAGGLPGSQAYENANAASWITSASYNFSDTNFGKLGNMFRDVLVWGFQPTQASLTTLASLSATISAKPPFGYITLVRTAFGALATASATTDTSLAHAAIRGVTDPMRTGITMILWVLFGWYLFKRFTHFQL